MTTAIIRGDARHLPLPDGCVDLVVTSPPFWQLRSYTDSGKHYAGQIGSEPTWQEYIANLLDCTREWIRVLKPEGNLFVELGDKYSSGAGPHTGQKSVTLAAGAGPKWVATNRRPPANGFPPKCLMDLPHRYAIGCVDELGLIKRAEIPWHHVNGLPESVTDRVRRAHSMVFHLVKQPRYYSAIDEIREPHLTAATDKRSDPARYETLLGNGWQSHAEDAIRGKNADRDRAFSPLGKLPGSVWSIPSQPLTVPASVGVDHFAAFPVELPRRIVLGWSPPGVCVACGQGRRPVVDKDAIGPTITKSWDGGRGKRGLPGYSDVNRSPWERDVTRTITGYACACPTPDAPTRPAVVLDPFAGTGTTLLAAAALGRHAIGIDHSADYTRLARWRVHDPGERAKAMQVPKPPPVPDGMEALFDLP